MKWIKKFFVKLKIKKNRGTYFEKSKKSIEDLKSIHILATSYENLVKTEASVKANWGNNVAIEGRFYDESRSENAGFSYQNFSLFGKPDKDLQDFIHRRADILIVTCTAFDPFTQLLVKEKAATYKIGFHSEEGNRLLDVMLEKEGANVSPNIENLLKYLKKII